MDAIDNYFLCVIRKVRFNVPDDSPTQGVPEGDGELSGRKVCLRGTRVPQSLAHDAQDGSFGRHG
jgi:hypothetical protein